MIRLTPFLKDPAGRGVSVSADTSAQQIQALNRVISVLMQGIALNGLRYDEAAFQNFQDTVWKMRAGFAHASDEDSAMLLAGAVIRLLEEHNDGAQAHLRARHAEMAEIAGIALETLLDVTHAKPECVARVRGMAQELARASSASAVAAVKSRLDLSLAEMRAKAQTPVPRSKRGDTAESETDVVTGLPDAGCAIEAIARAWPRRADHFVALFALEYLATINQRFGFRTGDELLSQLSQQVGQQVAAPDELFRWRGPCLAAVLHRRAPESMVASEIGRILPPRLESATTVREREAMVRVSTAWTLISLETIGTLDEAIARMNEFAGNRSRMVRQATAGA